MEGEEHGGGAEREERARQGITEGITEREAHGELEAAARREAICLRSALSRDGAPQSQKRASKGGGVGGWGREATSESLRSVPFIPDLASFFLRSFFPFS